MEYWCDCLGEAWGKLQWGVTPWVHSAVVQSAYFARQFGSLYIFRSIPTEYRNQPFKMHLKNSMRGWCSLKHEAIQQFSGVVWSM